MKKKIKPGRSKIRINLLSNKGQRKAQRRAMEMLKPIWDPNDWKLKR